MDFPTTNARFKRTPEWFDLPREVRSMHDDLERAAGYFENGGVFKGAAKYRPGKWKVIAGFTLQAVRVLERYALVRWEGEDLVVCHFDVHGHDAAIKGRELQALRRRLGWMKLRQQLDDALDRYERSDLPENQSSDQRSDPSARKSARSLNSPPTAVGTGVGTAVATPSLRPSDLSEDQRSGSPPPPLRTTAGAGAARGAGPGGGGPPFGWEEVLPSLPRWLGGWEIKAWPAYEALGLKTAQEVEALVSWIERSRTSPLWQKSPPFPPQIFGAYAQHLMRQRRKIPVQEAGLTKLTGESKPPQKSKQRRESNPTPATSAEVIGEMFPAPEELERQGLKARRGRPVA